MAALSCSSCNCSLVQRYKLLRCLHPVCVQCVARLIRLEDNTIKCPECDGITPSPGHGRSHLSTLPTCSLPAVVAGITDTAACADQVVQGGAEPAICEHCTEETPATSVCLDCWQDLCNEHAVGHTKKRKTQDHRVVPSGDERGSSDSREHLGPSSQAKCPLHLTVDVTQFCKACDAVACSVCLDRGAHGQHREALISIQEAGRVSRNEIEKDCQESGVTAVRLNEKVKDLETAKDGIREQATQLSKQITEAIGKKIEMLKQQEAKLLDDVDRLQWQNTLPLEKQSSELQQCLLMLSHLSDISETCSGDYDIVRVAPWLKDKATDIMSRADGGDISDSDCQLACADLDSIVTSEDIARVGVVFDQHGVDLEKSLVDFPTEVEKGQRFHVSVKLCNTIGEEVGEESPLYKSVSLSVTGLSESGDGSAASVSAPTPDECAAHVSQVSPRQWECSLESPGTHLLTVKCASRDLHRSPCSKLVLNPSQKFDSSLCHSTLQLSNDDKTVTCPATTSVQGNVYTAPFSSGVHHVHLKFRNHDKVQTGLFPMCGIVDSTNAPTEGQPKTVIGVSSGKGAFNGTATPVGQAWNYPVWTATEVDIFMSVNCDERTLSVRLVQPRVTVERTWSGIPQHVRIQAGLFYELTSFTLVPS